MYQIKIQEILLFLTCHNRTLHARLNRQNREWDLRSSAEIFHWIMMRLDFFHTIIWTTFMKLLMVFFWELVRKSYRFRATWSWVNSEIIFILKKELFLHRPASLYCVYCWWISMLFWDSSGVSCASAFMSFPRDISDIVTFITFEFITYWINSATCELCVSVKD